MLLCNVCALGDAPDPATGAPDADGDRIANTAQAIESSSPETVIAHRQSVYRARQQDTSDGTLLPARTDGRNGSLWFGDGWYVTGLVSLGLVLGLIFLLSLLARRYVLPGARLGGRELEVLARTYVGNKQSIALVRAGTRVLVVGVTANRVNLLTSLDDPVEAAHLIGQAAAGKSGSISSQFARRLEDESRQYADDQEREEPQGVPGGEFVVRTRRQLRSAIERMRAFGRPRGAEVSPERETVERRVAG